MEPRTKELMMYSMGIFVLCAAFTLVGLLYFVPLKQENRDLINISLGAIIGMAVNVIGYFYGSSKGSADKTAAIMLSTDTQAKSQNET